MKIQKAYSNMPDHLLTETVMLYIPLKLYEFRAGGDPGGHPPARQTDGELLI